MNHNPDLANDFSRREIPVEPLLGGRTEAAKDVADPFINENKNTTLHIKKESRKGRILIDIYRNRQSQSIISAYSMRGRSGAPVAYPLTWDVLEQMDDPREFDYKTVIRDSL